MSNSDRGMVKYMPYKSLVEQGSALARAFHEQHRVEKRILLEDEAEELNRTLTQYNGEAVTVVYWRDGALLRESGIIDAIDGQRRCLWINEQRVLFNDLQSINRM